MLDECRDCTFSSLTLMQALESDLIVQVQSLQVTSLVSWQVSTFHEGFGEGVRLCSVPQWHSPAPVIKISSGSSISGHEGGQELTCPLQNSFVMTSRLAEMPGPSTTQVAAKAEKLLCARTELVDGPKKLLPCLRVYLSILVSRSLLKHFSACLAKNTYLETYSL